MQNNIKCIIVDDEPNAIEMLSDCLAEMYYNIEVIGRYTTWNTAFQALRTTGCDLLFMDVSMPGKTGMDLLNLLPGITCEVIFITAHTEFALKAFQYSATGYILKPINERLLALAIDKAIERIKYKNISKLPPQGPGLSTKIGIPNKKGTDYLNPGDICYLEALNNCTRVVTTNKENELTSSYNLARFKGILEKHSFFLVHRSYYVNLNCITRYMANGCILMVNGDEIPVSKNLREDFLDQFEKVSRTD